MSPAIRVTLFGRMAVQSPRATLFGRASRKAQELLAYLSLNRSRPHRRESLAQLLWGEAPSHRSRKYLRQALWQIHKALRDSGVRRPPVLSDSGWVRLRMSEDLLLDVAAFEDAYRELHRSGRSGLTMGQSECLAQAVRLYRGDLLAGWYQPWCLSERERFRTMYVRILNRLTAHHEAGSDFESAMAYAGLAIQCDRANEMAHRSLMRLLYESGDRTGALRQFGRCRAALREELEVDPSEQTIALYEAIRSDRGRAP